MSQTLKPQEHALRATQSNASKINTWLYAHKYLIELYSLVRKAKLAHTQIFAIWSSHLFFLSNFQSVLIVSNMANWISTKLLTIRFQYFLIFWKDLEKDVVHDDNDSDTDDERYALRKKLRYYLGIFPKWRAPPPQSPPFGNPLFKKKNYRLFCILDP